MSVGFEVDCCNVKLLYLDILMCYLFVALLNALTTVALLMLVIFALQYLSATG